jgi:hypothetical protein
MPDRLSDVILCIANGVELGHQNVSASRAGSAAFLQSLEISSTSLRQWIGLTLLAWGIFASVSLYHGCNRLLDSKSTGSFMILFVIQDFSTTLTMALLVVLFLYLVRWHMLKRIERLRHMPGQRRITRTSRIRRESWSGKWRFGDAIGQLPWSARAPRWKGRERLRRYSSAPEFRISQD